MKKSDHKDLDFPKLDARITDADGEVNTLPDEFFTKAKRGFPWPIDHVKKVPVSIRLDADLIEFLRGSGKGWQSRANAHLRQLMKK